MWKEWEIKNWQRDQMTRDWVGKGGNEDRDCNGRTAFKREIWREWEKEEQEQNNAEVGDP